MPAQRQIKASRAAFDMVQTYTERGVRVMVMQSTQIKTVDIQTVINHSINRREKKVKFMI
jgi:hypothetical protein